MLHDFEPIYAMLDRELTQSNRHIVASNKLTELLARVYDLAYADCHQGVTQIEFTSVIRQAKLLFPELQS